MLDVVLLEVHALQLCPLVAFQVQLQSNNATRVAEANRNDQRFGRLFVEAEQRTFVGQIDQLRGFLREERRLPFVEPAREAFVHLVRKIVPETYTSSLSESFLMLYITRMRSSPLRNATILSVGEFVLIFCMGSRSTATAKFFSV